MEDMLDKVIVKTVKVKKLWGISLIENEEGSIVANATLLALNKGIVEKREIKKILP